MRVFQGGHGVLERRKYHTGKVRLSKRATLPEMTAFLAYSRWYRGVATHNAPGSGLARP